MSHIILLAGPGGVGKNSVLEKLLADPQLHLVRALKWTTRAKRPGEEEGREFRFVERHTFERGISAGALLEHIQFHGHFYGIARQPLTDALAAHQNPIIIVETNGVRTVRAAYPGQVLAIFLTAPTEELRARYIARGQSPHEADERLTIALRTELPQQKEYDLVVENRDGKLTDAVEKIRTYLTSKMNKEQL